MAVRLCPHCKTEISALEAAARSNDIVCPKCGARLEVSSASRTISSICGLIAAAIVWHLSGGLAGDLGGVLPTLYAFLAFGIVSPIVLMLAANLGNAPALPVAEPSHSAGSGGHGGSGDAGAHH